MTAVKQQKHLSLNFAIETKNNYPRARYFENNTFSCAKTVQLFNVGKKTPLLTQARSFSGRQLMSRNA